MRDLTVSNRTFFTALFFAVISASSVRAHAQAEVRHITPPQLDTANLGEKILCHRPMRHGTPNMSVTSVGRQVIAHDYGHGGSGWTLGPGSAKYVDDLLLQSEAAAGISKHSRITIIGAGALGMFTAYDLLQRGFKHIVIVADRFESLTSHNAGGLLAPVSMDNAPELQPIIDQIGIDAYRFYQAIAQGTHPHFASGALIVPTYFETREESGLEPYVGVVMQPAKDVVLDFGNGTTRPMVAYDDGIFIDTAAMMQSLRDYLRANRVRFVQKKVRAFAELDSRYVINCAGLGAAQLNGDSELVSVQGHLIMLKDQNPQDLQHMILVYFPEGTTASGFHVKRSFYIFPKRLPNSGERDVGVVGGTFIEGATPETPNEEEFDIMLDGARNFYGLPSP